MIGSSYAAKCDVSYATEYDPRVAALLRQISFLRLFKSVAMQSVIRVFAAGVNH